jgi:hypothetical protein
MEIREAGAKCHLLKCDAVWHMDELNFQRTLSPSSAGWKESAS